MPNRAIELRNMQVQFVAVTAESVILDTSAHVHASSGRPGIDAGSVWSQPVWFTILQGCVVRLYDSTTLLVSGGVIAAWDETYDHLVPLELATDAETTLLFNGAEGVLEIVGIGLRVSLAGEATYVAEVPGVDG